MAKKEISKPIDAQFVITDGCSYNCDLLSEVKHNGTVANQVFLRNFCDSEFFER